MRRDFQIFYTGDIHGYFSPIDYATGTKNCSGLANCAAEFRCDGNTLIIDGGDVFQGSPFTYFLSRTGRHPGCIAADIMNICGYRYYTLGNHDFSYGREELSGYISSMNAKCLCANISGIDGVDRFDIFTLENGLRIGLTGIITDYTQYLESPENIRGIVFSDPSIAAQKALEDMKTVGADATVCIYHGGFEIENEPYSGENIGRRICNELGFDLLLAAHQHIVYENLNIGGTVACEPPEKAAGYLHICASVEETDFGRSFSAESKLCRPGEYPDAGLSRYLEEYERRCAEWLDIPIGHLDVPLYPEDHIKMAEEGSLIANFFNQIQLEVSGADISVTSLGNDVRGFSKDVTIRDVAATYVFPNTLLTLEVNRSVLKKALERSAEYFKLSDDRKLSVSESFLSPRVEHFNFDYFSGVDAVADIRRPVGDRIVSISYKGKELDDGMMLKLCVNSFRASGAGGYSFYKDCPVVGHIHTEISELIMDYIERHRDIKVDKKRWLKVLY